MQGSFECSGIARSRAGAAATIALLATIPLGLVLSAAAQVAALAAILATAMATRERVGQTRAGGSSWRLVDSIDEVAERMRDPSREGLA